MESPGDWTAKKVRDAVEVRRGVSWSKEQEHGAPREGAYPVIRISNVQERLDLNDLLYIDGMKPRQLERHRAAKGWSVFVASNGNRNRIGNAVFVEEDSEYLFASFLSAARPRNENELLPKYFHRWLTSEAVQDRITATAEGSTGLSNMSLPFFTSMRVAYPEPEEQREIARVLDAVDVALDRTREAIREAERLKRSLMQSLLPPWFGFRPWSGGELPNRVLSIERGCEVGSVSNGSTPSRDDQRYWRDGTIPWLATGKVNEKIITAPDELVTETALRECSIDLIPKGSVLIAMIGQGKTRGMAAYLAIDACINQNFAAFTPGTRITGKWLYYYFDFHYFRLREMGGGTNQGALNTGMLKKVRLPVTDMDYQKECVQILEAVDETVSCRHIKLKSLSELKVSLMDSLMTGKIRIPAGSVTSGVEHD